MAITGKTETVTREYPVYHLGDVTLYRGILVVWDEDRDTRIMDFIDSLPDEIRAAIWLAYEHEAVLCLRWCGGHAPEGYLESGDAVEVGDDTWVLNYNWLGQYPD